MSGPSVVVDRAPDGWTHIGGPGMHLLIGLDEDDDRTLAASDSADGGDIDDVVEVLTTGGMRKAHHFVGVHWQPRTRIVAFGPVSALVTLADGSEHDVRAPSPRVWTDLELPDHPERIVLRVLEESERSLPTPPQLLVAGVPAAPPATTPERDGAEAPVGMGETAAQAVSTDAGSDDLSPAHEDPAPAAPVVASRGELSSAPAIPTFGAAATTDGAGPAAGSSSSTWDRSWARRDETPTSSGAVAPAEVESVVPAAGSMSEMSNPLVSQPSPSNASTPKRVSPPDVEAGGPEPAAPEVEAQQAAAPAAVTPGLRSWGSVAPTAPVRAATPVRPATPASSNAGVVPTTAENLSRAGEPVAFVAEPPSVAVEPVPTQTEVSPREQPSAPEPVVAVVAPAPEVPVATDLPSAPQRDLDSTWAARPLPDSDAPSTQAPPEPRVTPAPPARPASSALTAASPTNGSAGRPDAEHDDGTGGEAAAPSYDYLFGHTTAADEHRKVLAQLTAPTDEDGAHEDDEVLSVPAVADTSDAAVTNAAPAPEVPERPIPSAPQVPEGGLISSVPWASSAAPAPPEQDDEVPTFSGRHTPPPAPSLLPPLHTPPPGARAPGATPLISTGPPPAARGVEPESNQPDRWSAPHATPLLRTPPTVPIATTPPAPQPGPVGSASSAPGAEPSIDAPLGGPPSSAGNPSPATAPAPNEAAHQPPQPAYAIGGDAADGADATDDVDETELTVDRSALLEARHVAQNQTFSGPSVLAVLCAAGHPTPPHSDRCRVCGTGIPPQEPFTMPRPPLGVLRLSTGDVVTLDRSVLLGRAPKLGDGLAAHDRPHVVKVPSPERDVSRNHVEVILEGWHVLIRDLGTTNGTTVTLPGETPVRLRANDQQVLEPGSLVSMADEVSFTFEAAP
ncbi:FHA domain-containing protein [Terrabacter sp. 2RAF25]|uniref:FHA domain-containing protein n=1 Tax=Terrabacter sp. 2RAF25 TaxID=3232998 RepID=UPI003F9D0926